MSSIKFIYKSQYILDSAPIANSTHSITSGAVYDAIANIHTNTMFQTGYIPEAISQIKKQHNLSFTNGTLTLAKGDNVFVPNGIDATSGEFLYTTYTLPSA